MNHFYLWAYAQLLSTPIRWIRRQALDRIDFYSEPPADVSLRNRLARLFIKALDVPDDDVRGEAVCGLGWCRKGGPLDPALSKTAHAELMRILLTSERTVALAASNALPEFEEFRTQTIELLGAALGTQDKSNFHHLAVAIRGFGQDAKSLFPILQSVLGSDDPDLRWDALYSTGEMGIPATIMVPWLRQALRDPSGLVVGQSLSLLKSLAADATPALPEVAKLVGDSREAFIGEVSTEAIKVLDAMGPAARSTAPLLRKQLTGKNARCAAEALWSVADECESWLPQIIEDIEKHGDEGAADLVYRVGPPAKGAVLPLVGMLQSNDWDRQWAAACALGGIGPGAEMAIPALIDRMVNGGGQVPSSCATALARIGVSAVPELVRALNGKLSDFQVEVILVSLWKMGTQGSAALPVIHGLKKHASPNIRHFALIADARISQKGRAIADELAHLLPSVGDNWLSVQTVLALGYLGTEARDILPAVLEYMKQGLGDLEDNMPLKGPALGQLLTGNRADFINLDRYFASCVAATRIERSDAYLESLGMALAQPYGAINVEILEAVACIGNLARPLESDVRKFLRDSNPALRELATEALEAMNR